MLRVPPDLLQGLIGHDFQHQSLRQVAYSK